MENSREFHLSAKKKKSEKKLYIAMAIGGILLWVLSYRLFDGGKEAEGSYLLSCLFATVLLASIYMIFGGVSLYMETVGRKWKLVINEKGISEIGHPDSKKDDWHVSWKEIRKILPPNSQESKQAIIILYDSYNNITPVLKHDICDYDNLDKIYSYLKEEFTKQEQTRLEEFTKQEQIRLETLAKQEQIRLEELAKQEQIHLEQLAKEERVRQQQESAYFQRINRLADIQKIDPIQFEKLIFALFKRMGYDVLLTKASRDEGIDLIISKNGKKSVVQCKRYSGTVGQPVARDLYGSMVHNRAEDAYLITTGVFSLPAKTWASGKPIHLVDGTMLVEWIETILSKDGTGVAPHLNVRNINKHKKTIKNIR